MLLDTSISIPIPGINAPINVGLFLLQLLVLAPALGGFLLARESRDNTLLEIVAAILIVIATAIPATSPDFSSAFNSARDAIQTRWPLVVFILGIAWIRDGGFKMAIGIPVAVFGFGLLYSTGAIPH